MAWCLWFMDAEQTGFENQCGFYCNTSDSSFGPVWWVGNATHEDVYAAWDALGLKDARRMDDDELDESVGKVMEYLEEKYNGVD